MGNKHKWLFQDKQAAHKAKDTTHISVAIKDQLSSWDSDAIFTGIYQAANGLLFSLLVNKTIWINLGPLTNSDIVNKTDHYMVIQSFTSSVLHESWQVKRHLRIRQFLLLQ